MLIEDLLDIPNNASVNMIIAKKEIYDAAEITKADKSDFTKFVRQIRWCYKIDEDTLRVKPYSDTIRNYPEIEIINIELKEEPFQIYNHNTGNFHRYDARLDRIVDILLRFIPYPILLSAEFKDEIKFYVSHIRESLADSEKITLDEIIKTDWIKTSELTNFDKELITNLQLDNLDFTNTYKFYDSIVSAIIKYNGSKQVGTKVELNTEEIQKIMEQIHEIDRKINDLKVKIRKEPNYNTTVEYNMKIQELKQEKQLLEDQLTEE